MSSDSDGIIGGPAPRGEATDDDGIIGGPAVAVPALGRARRAPQGPFRAPPKQGKFNAWLLAAAEAGDSGVGEGGHVGNADHPDIAGVCAAEWEFALATDAAKAAHDSALGGSLGGTCVASTWGYIEYTISDIWQFDELVGLPEGVASNAFDSRAALEMFNCCKSFTLRPGPISVQECVHQMADHGWAVLLFPLDVLLHFFRGHCSLRCAIASPDHAFTIQWPCARLPTDVEH